MKTNLAYGRIIEEVRQHFFGNLPRRSIYRAIERHKNLTSCFQLVNLVCFPIDTRYFRLILAGD